MIRVEYLARDDRAALCEMLEDEVDFPQNLVYLYQRPSGPDENLLVWRDERIEGLLTGTFRHDFSDNRDFTEFGLPRAPHALLTRIHVRHTARHQGNGEALVAHFAAEADKRGCDFVGGYLDGSSDKTGRRNFFEHLGFTVSRFDNFGARTAEILASVANEVRP